MASITMQTNRLKKGMVITNDVYTNTGVVIVPEGTVVTKEVYDLLTKHFVDEVIVEYPSEKDADAKKAVRTVQEKQKKIKEFTRSFYIAEELLEQNFMDMVQQDKDIDVPTLLETVQSVMSKAGSDAELCSMLLFMKTSSENLYAHCIQVALYARLLAEWVKFTTEETELVILAGLFHDIGHLKCAKMGQESICLHEELERYYNGKHSHYGYKMFKNKTMDSRVKQAILTHHERMDGSGFPMGVTYTNINHIARVLAIADMYATLSMGEPGYPAMTPFEILNFMHIQEIGKYDSGYLLVFMEHVAQNFIQHKVLLNNGQTGIVVMLNKLDLTKPLIQVEDRFIDLAIQKDLMIEKILD